MVIWTARTARPLAICAYLTLILPGTAVAQHDFQTWHAAAGRYAEIGRWTLGAGGEVRLDDDSSHLWFIRATHSARYRWRENLPFDANLTYMRQRLLAGPEIDNVRAELALTPRWSIDDRVYFDVRNQLELWWREGDVANDVLFRVRPRFVVPLDSAGRASSLFFGNELLFSETMGFFQNRFYPFGVSLPVGSGAWVDLYTMFFSTELTTEGWIHGLVIGQNWRF